ncbi:MAG: hypothetical protein ACM3XM_19960 [Mycobacterium leprae]
MTENNDRKVARTTPESHLANAAHAAQSQNTNPNMGQQPSTIGEMYLDHGTPSLVAQDNPDDSQLGASDNKTQKKA